MEYRCIGGSTRKVNEHFKKVQKNNKLDGKGID
jgi:hypothetical protein